MVTDGVTEKLRTSRGHGLGHGKSHGRLVNKSSTCTWSLTMSRASRGQIADTGMVTERSWACRGHIAHTDLVTDKVTDESQTSRGHGYEHGQGHGRVASIMRRFGLHTVQL